MYMFMRAVMTGYNDRFCEMRPKQHTRGLDLIVEEN